MSSESVSSLSIEEQITNHPQDIQEEIETYKNAFNENGLEHLKISQIGYSISEEEIDISSISKSDVGYIDIKFNSPEQFQLTYSLYPNEEYNGIYCSYSILEDLVINASDPIISDLSDSKKSYVLSHFEEIVSDSDIASFLQSNRFIQKSQFIPQLQILRSNNLEYNQEFRYFQSEVSDVYISRITEYEQTTFTELKNTLSIYISELTRLRKIYKDFFRHIYFSNGISFPESIGKTVSNYDFSNFEDNINSTPETDVTQQIKGFQ